MWEGGCANELTFDPATIQINQADFIPESLEECQNECSSRDDCGYFEYCNSGDCENKCKLFPKSEIGITKPNGNPGTSCHAVFSKQDFLQLVLKLVIQKFYIF